MAPIPVILDTDIGGDIDDTWALAYLLKCPELDLKLVVCSTEDSRYKAKVTAKLLEVAGRTDIPVAIGLPGPHDRLHKTQAAWVEDYDLHTYPGVVHANGVAALCRAIHAQETPPTLVGIGPLTTVAAAVEHDPAIVGKCHFVGMHGSIERGHDGRPGPIAEYNVVRDAAAAQTVLHAPWLSTTITPLDTCGVVRLRGDRYQRVRACREPLTAAVIENYRLWRHVGDQFPTQSSILYDTVAVFLAFSRQWLRVEPLNVRVTDDGFTRRDDSGRLMDVATAWTDLDAFADHLVERLTAN